MKRPLQIVILLVLAAVAWYFIPHHQRETTPAPVSDGQNPAPDTANSDQPEPDVVIEMPQRGDLVTSPLRIKGRAKGNWFFEANIPVTLKNQAGQVIAQKGFHALTDWMTTGYVEFDDVLVFPTPTTEFGNLIISKDNPSGLPENDADFVVPVRFK